MRSLDVAGRLKDWIKPARDDVGETAQHLLLKFQQVR
jgi:hypothetical protein